MDRSFRRYRSQTRAAALFHPRFAESGILPNQALDG